MVLIFDLIVLKIDKHKMLCLIILYSIGSIELELNTLGPTSVQVGL